MTPVGRAEYRGPDRRNRRRREDDTTEHAIVDAVIENAPKVNRLETIFESAGRYGATFIVLATVMGGVVGGAGTALGMRIAKDTDHVVPITALVDSNARHILSDRVRVDTLEARSDRRFDSLLTAISDMSRDIATVKAIQCAQLRRENSDLLPFGCKESR